MDPLEERETRFRWQLVVMTLGRLLMNTAIRLPYPFLPEIARGLGVALPAAARLIALGNLAGFISPLFASLSERVGRRPVIVGAMLLFSAACALIFSVPLYWVFGAGLFGLALAKVLHDPAMQAYVADRVPYRSRGRAIALTEYSWGGALLLGAPAAGWLMERYAWQTPYLFLALGALGTALLLRLSLPRARPRVSRTSSLRGAAAVLREHPVVWAAVLFFLPIMMANDVFFIVYGDWMERQFDLNLAQLGLTTLVIGAAELSGSSIVAWASDRFGKRPVILVAGLGNALSYFLIPLTGGSLPLAIGGLFFLFLTFETTIVGGLPLMTELVPEARNAVLSVMLLFFSLGRTLGALLGPLIWARGQGLAGNGVMSGLLMLAALALLARYVHEGTDPAA